MFRTVPLSIIRSFSLYTQQCYMSCRFADILRTGSGRNCSSVLISGQWKTPDDGHRHCPKHIEFYSKNKFEKLVYRIGFVIRNYHDARSPERQTPCKWDMHAHYWAGRGNSLKNQLKLNVATSETIQQLCLHIFVYQYRTCQLCLLQMR